MPSIAKASAIRIVPVLDPTVRFKHPPPPAGLTYRGGPLLSSVTVKTLYWGNAWMTSQAALIPQTNQFFQFIVTSPLIDQLAEYSVSGFPIGHGSFGGTATIPGNLGATVTDAQIEQLVQQHPLATHPKHPPPPPPINNSLYFVFVEPGVSVTMGNGVSCGLPPTGFCGYHNDISGSIFYAVIPFPSCAGCGGTFSTFDAITLFASHELCEAITDPVPGQGWYSDQYGENGDFCNQQSKKIGPYTVQRLWSNASSSCI